jgi:hypothetical protein
MSVGPPGLVTLGDVGLLCGLGHQIHSILSVLGALLAALLAALLIVMPSAMPEVVPDVLHEIMTGVMLRGSL